MMASNPTKFYMVLFNDLLLVCKYEPEESKYMLLDVLSNDNIIFKDEGLPKKDL